jgi:DNA (cytosine-5)-methyltransferase 1
VLDAADYGVAQHRERVFLVGVRGGVDYRFPAPTHGPDSPAGTPFYLPRQAVRGIGLTQGEVDARLGTRYGHLLAYIPPGLNYSYYTARMGHPRPLFAWRSKFSDFLYKADPDRPVRTIKADGGGCTGPFHWDNRPFAAGELKRLQTIPDSYALTGGRGAVVAQVGNAVPCQLARLLALSILGQVFHAELPFELRLLSPEARLGFRQRQQELREVYRMKETEAFAGLRSTRAESPPEGRSYQASLTTKLG